ncbi:hypothetical protein D3C75_1031560 [compost metagenome]
MARLHALHPERIDQPLGDVRPVAVEAKERAGRDVAIQLRAVVQRGLAQAIEHPNRQAAWVVFGLEHHRRNGADQCRLLHPIGPVAADVAGDFATPG